MHDELCHEKWATAQLCTPMHGRPRHAHPCKRSTVPWTWHFLHEYIARRRMICRNLSMIACSSSRALSGTMPKLQDSQRIQQAVTTTVESKDDQAWKKLTTETSRAVPSVGRTALLLLVDGNLPQQWHSLTVPVQDEGMVGCYHRVVTLPNSLQADLNCPIRTAS